MVESFDYSLDFKRINFREHPELYIVGRGEQGVLSVEPYKSEILPHWRFRSPDVARESARKIYEMFLDYKKQGDFVGMDMARKFLQMGYTRSRRYANHPSGRKYDPNTGQETKRSNDEEKAESARIFYEYYLKAREDEYYQSMKAGEWSMAKKATKKKSGGAAKKKGGKAKKKSATKKSSKKKTVKKKTGGAAKKKTIKKKAGKKTGAKKKTGKKTGAKKKSGGKEKNGLYANIHKAQKRAARGGRPTRKKGAPGAPTEKDFKNSAKTAKS